MINKIFWDIDETLIHTTIRDPKQDHFKFTVKNDFSTYHTIVRPCSHDLIEFSRELVGAKNVHILTTSLRDYARKVNRLANWGFKNKDIFCREDLKENTVRIGGVYGCDEITNPHAFADPNNVLIDNLRPRDNWRKVSFIGISSTYHTNYLDVKDYYGVNYPDDSFEEDVKEFLLKRFKENES
jgi:hypothetical protein